MKKWIKFGIALLSLSVLTLFPWGKPAQAAGGDIEINEQNFQDPSYRDYLYNMIDRDGDRVLSESERDCVDVLDLSKTGVIILERLEIFPNLKVLICDSWIQTLDVSGNPELLKLDCNGTYISQLDVSNNPLLEELNVVGTMIDRLDLSRNPNLKKLFCGPRQIPELDISGTQLQSKDFAGHFMDVYHGTANRIVIDENTFPDPVFCQYVKDYYDTNKSGILGENETVYAYLISVMNMGITSLKGIEYFPNLEDLNCSDNELKTLDLTRNSKLKSLNCDKNQLYELKLGEKWNLKGLSAWENQLKSLDVSGAPELESLLLGWNQLQSLSLICNTKLKGLNCMNNQLTALDVSKNTSLEELYCSDNSIKELDTSNAKNLTVLRCSGNKLTNLDLRKNTKLSELYCDSNSIEYLNLSENKELASLSAHNKGMAYLVIVNNPSLKSLYLNKKTVHTTETYKDGRYYRYDPGYSCSLSFDTRTRLVYLKTGWLKEGEKYRYIFMNGYYALEDWVSYKQKWYYFDENGYMVTSWKMINGKWYYLDPKNGDMVTQWKKLGGKWYYFHEKDGYMMTGWLKYKKLWYYLDPKNGDMAVGWRKIDGKWYYFSIITGAYTKISPKPGWTTVDGKRYYIQNGHPVTGWKMIGGKWYYFNPDTGVMTTSWLEISGKWYHFNSKGIMDIGWNKLGGKWYYLDKKSGAMVTGWKKLGGKWYYFDKKSGAMVTGSKLIDGTYYYFRSDGAWDKSVTEHASNLMASDRIPSDFDSYSYDNHSSYGGYKMGKYPDGKDYLEIGDNGTFSGSFIGKDGTGCKYHGRFTSIRMVEGIHDGTGNDYYEKYVFSGVLTEFVQEYEKGSSYYTETGAPYDRTYHYVTAADHPVFKKGKTYYFVIESAHHPSEYGGSGGSMSEMLDSQKKATGYGNAVGQY